MLYTVLGKIIKQLSLNFYDYIEKCSLNCHNNSFIHPSIHEFHGDTNLETKLQGRSKCHVLG